MCAFFTSSSLYYQQKKTKVFIPLVGSMRMVTLYYTKRLTRVHLSPGKRMHVIKKKRVAYLHQCG